MRQLLDAAAEVFRDRLSSGSRFEPLLDRRRPAPAAISGDTAPFADISLPYTQSLSRSVESAMPQIGDMPPEPPTVRGRIGAVLVGVVRRALFWYTEQIRAFHGSVAQAAREQAAALLQLSAHQQRQQILIADALRRVGEVESEGREARRQIDQKLAEVESVAREAQRQIDEEKADRLNQELSLAAKRHANDALFVDHAEVFRGDRAEIKSRLAVYIPYAKEVFAATDEAPALDLGCGRGEWLEILQEAGISASGIDLNDKLVERCRKMGFDVRSGEVPGMLSTIPDASLSIVSAFHLLEHIPFPDVVEVIDQTVRILRPGGIAIFETPNPHNFFAGTRNFYMDPTHRHPLPSEFLVFVARSRGLVDPKVIELSPYPEHFRLQGADCPSVQFINDHFFGPQDYGLVGFKVEAVS